MNLLFTFKGIVFSTAQRIVACPGLKYWVNKWRLLFHILSLSLPTYLSIYPSIYLSVSSIYIWYVSLFTPSHLIFYVFCKQMTDLSIETFDSMRRGKIAGANLFYISSIIWGEHHKSVVPQTSFLKKPPNSSQLQVKIRYHRCIHATMGLVDEWESLLEFWRCLRHMFGDP